MPHRALEPAELIEQLDAILADPNEEHRVVALRALVEAVRGEDIADVLAQFSPEQKVEIFGVLPPDWLPLVIDETDEETTRDLVSQLSTPEISEIVEQMPPDEATDLIGDLDEAEQERVLADLEPDTAGEVRKLMQHHPESAGGIMTSDFIAVRASENAGKVLEHVQETLDSEVVSYVYVTEEDGKLTGVFSIRELLKAAPEDPVSSFMSIELISADVTDDQERVATLARKYNLNSIPIVDGGGLLVGVATIDDIIDILSEEADEDIYRMAGTAPSHPAQQRVWRRALIRIPWLLLPVVSGFVIAGMHAGTEAAPETVAAVGRALTLAAFIPLVMGISGAVGTQTAIMMVRGMATGDIEKGRGKRVFLQELGIGAIIAIAIGGTVTFSLWGAMQAGWVFGDGALAPAVGLGLAGGILLASIFGTLFPIGCTSIGLDPALVAGPFITSLNDVVAAATYLGIAQLILSGAS